MFKKPSADRLLEFKAIVDCGSIMAAAEHLQMTRPTLSRRLGDLEKMLGVRLLQRNTRSLFPTVAGKELYHRATRVVADIDAAWTAVQNYDSEPSGPLCVSLPESDMLAVPLFTEFAAKYPKVSLDVVVTNRRTNFRAASVDVAMCFGPVRDPDLIVKKLFLSRRIPMATKGYLDAAGTPATPEQLADHKCITLRDSDGLPETRWPTTAGGSIEIQPRLLSAGFRLMLQAVHSGLGIGLLPESELAKNPELVALFPDEVQSLKNFSLVYVERDFQLPHVRAFVDEASIFWKRWIEEW
ncbi:LysR family transcriptional regulator [Pseudovibrio ascidiaceicola]|uniref:LysR family transcriptional regulator n=1 Tax=Pseudovibrio ascidiaceicola TaxID=285279 RepID=UPI003D35C006